MELYTALTSGVPIVALNVQNANPYNYAAASDFLMHFDEQIDIVNPGAAQLLVDLGVEPEDVAYLLSDSLPNIISTDFNPNASEKVLQASLEDLVDSMRKAKPLAPSMSKEEWLEKRKAHKPSGVPKKAHGSNGAAVDGPSAENLAEVPLSVPELPNAFLVRQEDLDNLKGALLNTDGTTALTAKKQTSKVGAHGMGGVGKTTIAAALVHDDEIRRKFDTIVWVSVGADPDLRQLQDSILEQIAGTTMPPDATTASLVVKALRDAAKASRILLVLDDVRFSLFSSTLIHIDSSRLHLTSLA
jgi:hypothetical protein